MQDVVDATNDRSGVGPGPAVEVYQGQSSATGHAVAEWQRAADAALDRQPHTTQVQSYAVTLDAIVPVGLDASFIRSCQDQPSRHHEPLAGSVHQILAEDRHAAVDHHPFTPGR